MLWAGAEPGRRVGAVEAAMPARATQAREASSQWRSATGFADDGGEIEGEDYVILVPSKG